MQSAQLNSAYKHQPCHTHTNKQTQTQTQTHTHIHTHDIPQLSLTVNLQSFNYHSLSIQIHPTNDPTIAAIAGPVKLLIIHSSTEFTHCAFACDFPWRSEGTRKGTGRPGSGLESKPLAIQISYIIILCQCICMYIYIYTFI